MIKADEETVEPGDMAQPLGRLGVAGLLDIKSIALVFEVDTVEQAEVLEDRLDELLSDRPYSIDAEIETKNKRMVNRRRASPAPSPMDKSGWN